MFPMRIEDLVRKLRPMREAEKQRALQLVVGPVDLTNEGMAYRANLMTALREAKVWPYHVP